MNNPLYIGLGAIFALLVLLPAVVNAFLRNVDAGEIRLVSWLNGKLVTYRGPCKALLVPLLTVSRVIPASAINVDIDITDQTSDLDPNGQPAPVKVTVKASAIVSVGETDAMVNTAANKFFSKTPEEQLNILTDVLSSAGRRAINLLRHDQLFNAKSAPSQALIALQATRSEGVLAAEDEDTELAIIIKDACSRELLDLGLSFNSLNIKGVQSEVAEARRRESAARARASADVVQAQEEQRARIAQLEAQQKVNDQERALNMQIAANGASIARAEADKQAMVRLQREAELGATQITQARADAEQNFIRQEAEGRAQAVRIRLMAEAEAEAIRMKAMALADVGQSYLDLRRLELAPALTREVASALGNGQFVNFGTTGAGGQSAAASGSDDVMRVVQTLMAAQIITNNKGQEGTTPNANGNGGYVSRRPALDVQETNLLEGDGSVNIPPLPSNTPTKGTFRKGEK